MYIQPNCSWLILSYVIWLKQWIDIVKAWSWAKYRQSSVLLASASLHTRLAIAWER